MRCPSSLQEVCKSRFHFFFSLCPSPIFQHAPLRCFAPLSSVCTEAGLDNNLHSLLCHHRAGVHISSNSLLSVLQPCIKCQDLLACRKSHALMISIGFSSKITDFHHACIHLFAQCNALLDANILFSCIEEPNVFTWHAILSAHVTLEESQVALVFYFQILEEGLKPNKSVYLCALKACSKSGALGPGRLIHSDILKDGTESGVVVGTVLVNLYATCGSLEDARAVFEKLSSRNLVSWGALMAGYTQHGKGLRALELYEKMLNMGLTPDESLFSCALKACGSIKANTLGLLIHDKVIRESAEGNVVLGNTLIDMYAKFGVLVDARKVFDTLSNRTPVTWSAMLAGYASKEDGPLALELFSNMQKNGVKLNTFISSSLLKASGQMGDLNLGRVLHDNIIRSGLEADLVVGNALIDLYVRCGSMEEAHLLFDASHSKDDVAWGSLISGCVQASSHITALNLFERMQREERIGNSITFASALQACGGIRALTEGKLIHNQVVVQGLESNDCVGSSIVDMYAKCACLTEVWKVFEGLRTKTSTSWGALIDGFASQEDHGHLALHLFKRMQEECLEPNMVLFSSALKACSNIGGFHEGRLIHNQMICSGLEFDLVAGNTLVDMYIKSGSLDCANKVFDQLVNRNVATWNSLIAGYTELCHYAKALELFGDMQKVAIEPDRITILCTLKACGGLGCLGQGILLHNSVLLGEIEVDLSMRNALMDMYARCGSMEDAEKVFVDLTMLDIISWGTIIAGHALQGDVEMVGQYLSNMRMQGMMADEGIFNSALSACRQGGHVRQASRYFLSMREDCRVTLNNLHFNCMADLIGRIGQLYDAEKFLLSNPSQADSTGWMSLLTSCKSYGNVKLGRKCLEQAILIEPDCASGYILMSGIYADAQEWDEVDMIFEMRQLASVKC